MLLSSHSPWVDSGEPGRTEGTGGLRTAHATGMLQVPSWSCGSDLGVSQWLWRPLKDSEARVGQTESPQAQVLDWVVSYGAVIMPKPPTSNNQTLPLPVGGLPAVPQTSAPHVPALPAPKSPPSLRIRAGGFPLPKPRPDKRQTGKCPVGGTYHPSRGREKGPAAWLMLCPAALEESGRSARSTAPGGQPPSVARASRQKQLRQGGWWRRVMRRRPLGSGGLQVTCRSYPTRLKSFLGRLASAGPAVLRQTPATRCGRAVRSPSAPREQTSPRCWAPTSLLPPNSALGSRPPPVPRGSQPPCSSVPPPSPCWASTR